MMMKNHQLYNLVSIIYFSIKERSNMFRKVSFVFLLSFVAFSFCYGGKHDKRIKELEEAQFKKELELSELGEIIDKKYSSLDLYKTHLLNHYWTPSQENKSIVLQKQNESLKTGCIKSRSEIEGSFDRFLKEVGTAFNSAKNIRSIIEEEKLDQINIEDFRIVLLRVILEQNILEKLVEKFEISIQELTKINQELTILKKKA